MHEELLDNIQKLREKFLGEDPAALAEIRQWEKTVKQAIIASNAKRNAGIQMMIEECRKRVRMANSILINDRELTEKQRDKIFERRDSYEWFLNVFDEPEKAARMVEKNVQEELK